jgi:hypothetical protein
MPSSNPAGDLSLALQLLLYHLLHVDLLLTLEFYHLLFLQLVLVATLHRPHLATELMPSLLLGHLEPWVIESVL